MIDEPLLKELRIVYDRYVDNVGTLEKKSQNLVIISGIMIALLMGANIVDPNTIFKKNGDETSEGNPIYLTYSVLITMIILSFVIITSRISLKVRDQLSPINIPYFYRLNSDHIPTFDSNLLSQLLVHNSELMKKIPEYFIRFEDDAKGKTINFQQQMISSYIGSCHDIILSSKRIKKWLRISELSFMIGICFSLSIPIIVLYTIS